MGMVLMIGLIIEAWDLLPETIPSHFNAAGIPDGYGHKNGLLMLPVTAFFFYLLFSLIRRFPYLGNYPWKITAENAYTQYRLMSDLLGWLKVELIWCFAYITRTTIRVALGQIEKLDAAFLPVFLLVVFGTITFILYRAYRRR